MIISDEKIEKIMQMSYVQLAPAEKATLANDLRKILNWVEQLQDVDTTGIEPLISMSPHPDNLVPDEPKEPLSVSEALSNAPEHDGAYFHVPSQKIVKT